ncbi:MAG: DNA recombination/repair protein RecA [Aquamicrobium sp.]|uniref:hypothetical protein n=1 Tax=Aquamicrobium sp. TaxID=1872579 RepID=UPI00349E8A23|nr:DNA recombination/repair protein RecA [Aquamicrobium sp.]
MKISKKAPAKATVGVADLLATFQKDKGDAIGSFGGRLVNSTRIPTGLFPLDLALGGGFPRGKTTTIFGPESSNKTNIALRAIAMHQLLWPELICVFVDVENEFDPAWAKALGVNTDQLVVLKPAYAEEAVDLIEGMLHAHDVGMVVLDSIAALVGTAELEKSAEGAVVGGVSLIMGKLYRKTVNALSEAEKQGRYPSLFYINQITTKIGVMFGNPEAEPGGNKPKYQSAIRLRVHGSNVMDKTISDVMPVAKEVSFVIKKWKTPILAASGRFEMATQPHKGLQVGQCDDFNTVSEYLKTFGLFDKGDKGKGWLIYGQHYDTIAPFRERLYGDEKFGAQIRRHIISTMLKGTVLEEGEA